MQATYMQKGESIYYKNETSNTIKTGEVVKIGDRIGIAGADILPGATGAILTEGCWKMDKDTSNIAVGEKVYFDYTNVKITTSATVSITTEEKSTTTLNNVVAGYAIAAAGASATSVVVKINA